MDACGPLGGYLLCGITVQLVMNKFSGPHSPVISTSERVGRDILYSPSSLRVPQTLL